MVASLLRLIDHDLAVVLCDREAIEVDILVGTLLDGDPFFFPPCRPRRPDRKRRSRGRPPDPPMPAIRQCA